MWEAWFGYIKWWIITRKLNKSYTNWNEEVILLSNQVIPASQSGNRTVSPSFQSKQDESLCKKLDLDTSRGGESPGSWINLIGVGMKKLSHFQIRWFQLSSLGIGQLLRRSNQNRMNHYIRSLIWIDKVVENHQEVEKNLIGVGMKKLSHFLIRWFQFPRLGIRQLLRRSNQTRMNHFVRSFIWIHKVVENHQVVE